MAEGLLGIRGPMVLSPETTKPLGELVQVLLTGPQGRLHRSDRRFVDRLEQVG